MQQCEADVTCVNVETAHASCEWFLSWMLEQYKLLRVAVALSVCALPLQSCLSELLLPKPVLEAVAGVPLCGCLLRVPAATCVHTCCHCGCFRGCWRGVWLSHCLRLLSHHHLRLPSHHHFRLPLRHSLDRCYGCCCFHRCVDWRSSV